MTSSAALFRLKRAILHVHGGVLCVSLACRRLSPPLVSSSGAASQPAKRLGSGHRSPSAVRPPVLLDRKSTRLNSSHGYISYAVFCLKKKKKKHKNPATTTSNR